MRAIVAILLTVLLATVPIKVSLAQAAQRAMPAPTIDTMQPRPGVATADSVSAKHEKSALLWRAGAELTTLRLAPADYFGRSDGLSTRGRVAVVVLSVAFMVGIVALFLSDDRSVGGPSFHF